MQGAAVTAARREAPLRPSAGRDPRRSAADPRYWFFAGKGGVGKTTCAAAAGLAMAETGRRVLIVSTDPAHSLGDALESPLGPRATGIRTRRGRLSAAELNADKALEQWVAARRTSLRAIAERGTFLDREDVDRLLRLSLPGADELMGLMEVARLAREAPWDDVVVDTAPTGHTLRLLAMPETLHRLAGLLDEMYAKHRFLSERLSGRYRRDASDGLIAELETEGLTLYALLRDRARCTFSWVLLPDVLSVEETRDGLQELRRSGIVVQEVIVNQLTPPPPGPCRFCEARIRAERTMLKAIRASFPGQALRLLSTHRPEPRGRIALRAMGARLIGPVRPAAPFSPDRRGPAVPAPPKGVGDRGWLRVVAPPGVRLLLFAGKGGVGKTTCAAATSLALAEDASHRRVLLLSTDPAHSIADVLNTPLGDDERPVPGAPPGLRARELDARRAFQTRREGYRAEIDGLFRALGHDPQIDAPMDRAAVRALFEVAPPGLDEVLAMFSVTEALMPRGRGAAAQTVVLDTAPTGHALRLLALPGAALEWVQALLAILLKYRRVMGLGQIARDLLGISRSLRQLDALLRDARTTRVVVVTRAGAVPRLETIRLLRRLRELRIPVSALILNAVTPPGCARCARERTREARERKRLAAESAAVARARCELVQTPAIAPPPRGVAGLTRWERGWTRVVA